MKKATVTFHFEGERKDDIEYETEEQFEEEKNKIIDSVKKEIDETFLLDYFDCVDVEIDDED